MLQNDGGFPVHLVLLGVGERECGAVEGLQIVVRLKRLVPSLIPQRLELLINDVGG